MNAGKFKKGLLHHANVNNQSPRKSPRRSPITPRSPKNNNNNTAKNSIKGPQSPINMKKSPSSSLASGKKKLEIAAFPWGDLPNERNDPVWSLLQTECKLTLAELSAIKNARCVENTGGTAADMAGVGGVATDAALDLTQFTQSTPTDSEVSDPAAAAVATAAAEAGSTTPQQQHRYHNSKQIDSASIKQSAQAEELSIQEGETKSFSPERDRSRSSNRSRSKFPDLDRSTMIKSREIGENSLENSRKQYLEKSHERSDEDALEQTPDVIESRKKSSESEKFDTLSEVESDGFGNSDKESEYKTITKTKGTSEPNQPNTSSDNVNQVASDPEVSNAVDHELDDSKVFDTFDSDEEEDAGDGGEFGDDGDGVGVVTDVNLTSRQSTVSPGF